MIQAHLYQKKTNIPPSITLKHTTREIKEKILTWERAKHDLQKISKSENIY